MTVTEKGPPYVAPDPMASTDDSKLADTSLQPMDEEKKAQAPGGPPPGPPPGMAPSDFPDGGLQAWLVVFGAWCSMSSFLFLPGTRLEAGRVGRERR